MKFFKVTDRTADEEFYLASALPNETPTHLALSHHLDTDKDYKVEEVSEEEFCDPSDIWRFRAVLPDPDCEDDWDWEDEEDDADCFCD
jgi:hypothetical protein